MELPEILKGGVHLPLQAGTTSAEAIGMANGFYQTSVDPTRFKRTQAFYGIDGVLQLELIDDATGELVETFYNRSTGTPAPDVVSLGTLLALNNPLDAREFKELLGPAVVLQSAEEFSFLDLLGSGNTYPVLGTDNSLAYQLSTLLNVHQFIGTWVSGTMGSLATGGFTLVYKGPSSEAPVDFLVDYSPQLAIIRLNHGHYKGYICLRT
jgi:hypothetical protein